MLIGSNRKYLPVIGGNVNSLRLLADAEDNVNKCRLNKHLTDVPDNRRPRWPNFKQTEEFYNITIFFFNSSKFTVEVKNLADIYCIFKNFEVLKKYYYFVNFLNLFKFGHLGRSVIWDVGHLGLHHTA